MKYYDSYEYGGEGYRKLFNFRNWRIAMLNYTDELKPESIEYVESHRDTDEVFVLLAGECSLIFADIQTGRIKSLSVLPLEKGKIFKVPAGVFHTHVLSGDAKLLIVEEDGTDYENSPRVYFTETEKSLFIKLLDGEKP